jgi:signal transduction histidine kinase
MALFTEDARFVVYMDTKSDIPSQEIQGRDALAPAFDNLNQYVATTHFNGQSTVVLDGSEATGVSYCLAHNVSVHGRERRRMIASQKDKRDGTWRWFLSRAEPSRDDHGDIVRWFGVTLDIHDGKVAEGELRELRANLSQTSRAALVSEISASIAHELNQTLSSLLSNAQACFRWLTAQTPDIQSAITSIERVVRDGRAADAAIRNIRALYKQQPTVKASCNMVELLGEVIALLKEDASRRSTPIEYEF